MHAYGYTDVEFSHVTGSCNVIICFSLMFAVGCKLNEGKSRWHKSN